MRAARAMAAFAAALWIAAGSIVWFQLDGKLRELLVTFLFNAAAVAVILTSAGLVGARIRRIVRDESEGTEGFLASMGLGIGAYILALFAVGMAGVLYRPVILAMVGIPLILSVGRIRAFLESRPWNPEDVTINPSALEWIAIISFSIIGGLVILSLLQPEVFFDTLYYHIAFPSLYLIRHRIDFFPHAVHSALPSYIDLSYTLYLSFAGPGAVRLVHSLFFLGSILWIYTIGKRVYNKEAGLVGCMLWAAIPGVHWIAGLGGNDMGVAFFGLGAFSFLMVWIFGGMKRSALLISAVFLGLAMGSKYTALMIGAVCAAGVLAGAYVNMRSGNCDFRKAARNVVLFGVVSISVASPWYIRNLVLTGDPLYPALSKEGTPGRHARKNVLSDSPKPYPALDTFVKLPIDLWEKPQDFGPVSRVGLGVWAFIPAFLWGLWRRGRSAWISAGFLIMYLLWSRSILTLRFLYPGLALGAIAAGGMLAMAPARSRLWRIPVAIFLILVALFDIKATLSFYESSPIGAIKFFSSNLSSEEALNNYAPHSAPAAFVRENLPANAKLLFAGETQGYYFQRNYMPTSAVDIHPLEGWVKEVHSGAELRDLLIKKGFTHILVCYHEWDVMNRTYGYLSLDAGSMKIFQDMLGGLKQVYTDRYYQIYEL